MRIVPVRSVEQQATTVIHKAREMLVATYHDHEFITRPDGGVRRHRPRGQASCRRLTAMITDPEDATIPSGARVALSGMIEVLNILTEQITALETRIKALVRENEGMRLLQTIPGIGPILASALAAIVTDPRHFGQRPRFRRLIALCPGRRGPAAR